MCLEDFETRPDGERAVDHELGADGEGIVVVLPCKAHFFHEECIAEWMKN